MLQALCLAGNKAENKAESPSSGVWRSSGDVRSREQLQLCVLPKSGNGDQRFEM